MNEEKIFYVYGYIRLDTNTYFYIGKGKDNRYLRLDNRKAHFMNILNKVDCVVEILYDNLTEEQIVQWKYRESYATGTHIKCIELDKEFPSINNAVKYIKSTYNILFNKHSLSKCLKREFKQNWYGEIEIDGVITKLHWIYI